MPQRPQDYEYYSEMLRDGRVAIFPGRPPKKGKYYRSAQARWDAANLVTFGTHVDPETAARFKAACLASGKSPYKVLKEYVTAFADNAQTPGNGGG